MPSHDYNHGDPNDYNNHNDADNRHADSNYLYYYYNNNYISCSTAHAHRRIDLRRTGSDGSGV